MRSHTKVFLLMLTTAVQSAAGAPIILGHRGARALFPENTKEGFYKVLDAGIRHLELDVGMTKDGSLVIYHDTAINPLICESRALSVPFFSRPLLLDLTDAQIATFDCGSRTQWWRFRRQQKIPGAQIPRLADFLAAVKSDYSLILDEITFLIEVKVKDRSGETASPEEFASKISAVIEESGLKSSITVQSFSVEFLRKLQQQNPSIERALLWDNRWFPTVSELKELEVRAFLPKFSILNDSEIARFREAGFPIIPWTLNSEKDWKRAVDWKLDGIITDDPMGLKAFLSRL